MTYQTPRRLLILSVLLFAVATLSLVGGRAFQGASSKSSLSRAASSPARAKLSAKGSPLGVRSPISLGAAAGMTAGSLFVPMVTATKSATLLTDVNGNGFVNPGDTLMYSVVVANAGTDATSVVFTDQLNSNLTLVGSAIASPIATNDAYSVIGNVGITVPVGAGLLSNDVNPQGSGTMSASAGATSTQGGAVSVAANGSFTYNPPAGFEGTDTFTYTLTHSNGKADTGTVTLTVSRMIWFVNNSGPNGDGRLGTPFNGVSNFVSGAADDPGDIIFVYGGGANYIGPLTLLNNQILIGQGATASISTIATISVPTFSNALPATGGTRPVIRVNNNSGGNNLTLGSGNIIRGFNLETDASGGSTTGTALIGTNFGNLSALEISITSNAGTQGNCTGAVRLTTGNPTATFTRIDSNNCTSGIVLSSTTGSFTIAGTGSAGSGGTIQNSSDDGINGTTVNSFSMSNASVINNGNSGTDEGIEFDNLTGTSSLTNLTVTGNRHNNFDLDNTTGTLSSLTISGSTFSSNNATDGNDGVSFQARNTAVVTAVSISSTTFSNNKVIGLQVLTADTATINSFVVTGCTFSDTGTGNSQEIGGDFSTSQSSSLTFKLLSSTLTGHNSHAINAFTAAGSTGGTLNGTIDGNTIGTQAVVDSGSKTGNGMRLNINGNANARIKVNNNTLRQIPTGRGIEAIARNGTGGASFIITNNTVVQPTGTAGAFCGAGVLCPLAPIYVQSNALTTANTVCSVVTGNTAYNPVGLGSGSEFSAFLLESNGSTHTYEGTFVDALTSLTNTNPGCVTKSVNAGVSQVSPGTCAQPPPEAPPVEGEGQGQNAALFTPTTGRDGGSTSSTLMSQVRKMAAPVFSAFAAPTSYLAAERLISWFEPTVSAAELATSESSPIAAASTGVAPRTILINSKGEYTIVPTAALMSGELITINGGGAGFTLPAGESTTIMFNATISSAFSANAITNQASVSGAGFGPILSNNLSTPVIQPPTISKAFNPLNIALSGTNQTTSTLTLTLLNGNVSQQLTGVAFSDTFPAGLAVADTPTASTTNCGAATFAPLANATSLSFSTGVISVGTPCVVSVKVKGTTLGAKLNSTTGPTSTQANAGVASPPATLNVLAAPSFTKNFGAPSIAVGGTTSLTFNITNNDTSFGLTAVGFTDTLPAGLTVAAVPNVTGSCGGGTIGATGGGASITLTSAALAASGSCSFSVDVTGTTAGTKNNSVSLITNETGTNTSAATASISVFGPPTISKSFTPNTIVTGQTSTLNITVTNPAGNPGTLTGLAFTDTLPAGITASDSSGPGCGGTVAVSSNVITLTGGSLTAGSNCVIPITVTGMTASGSAYTNTISSVSSANGGTNSTPANANITVSKANTTAAVTADTPDPTVTNQSYTVSASVSVTAPGSATPTAPTGTITVSDGSQTCIITLPGTSCPLISITAGSKSLTATYNGDSNFNASAASPTVAHTVNKADTTTTITSDSPDPSSPGQSVTVNFTVTANPPPPAAPPGDGLTFLAVAQGRAIAAAVPIGSTPTGNVMVSDGVDSCTGTVASGTCNITLTTTGNRTLTATYVGDTNFNGSSDTEPHAVTVPPTVTKSFLPTQIKVGETSVMTFLVNNPNAGLALTGISFADTFPAGIEVDNPVVSTNTCGGSFVPALAGAATSFNYTGGSLAVSGNCSISVQVKATTAGLKNNTTGPVTSTETGGIATSNTATLTVVGAPVLSKAFTPTTVALGVASSLGFTITNNNTTVALTGIAFTDTLPAGLTVATSGPTPACGGGSVSTTAPNTISFTGGALAIGSPVPATCTFSVNVTPVVAGMLNNTSGVITSIESGPGATSNTAVLMVTPGNTSLTSLTDSPDPSVTGQAYTAGFTLNVLAPGVGTPTGTVTVNDGAGGMCTATLPATSCSLTSTLAGNKTLTFSYSGDTNFNPSSNTAGHAVNKANTTTTITADTPDPSVFGQNYAVTATVGVNSPGSGTPSGTITVTDGTNNCTITLPATSCNLPSTSVGAKTLTATYNGDVNYFASGPSVGQPHTVNKADTVATIISDNPDTSALGQNVTVDFTVAASSPGSGTPTGNVTVTVSGGAETCTGALAVGAGSCVIALTHAGSRTLTATYAGDTNFNGSSDTEPHTVVAPPVIAKSFNPTSTPIGMTSQLTLTISNPAVNTVNSTGVTVTDNFPAGLVAGTLVSTSNCGGLIVTDAGGGGYGVGDTGIKLNNATVASGFPCVVITNVTPTVAGPFVNVTGNVSSTNGGTGPTATATLLTNTPPTITSETRSVKAGSSAASFNIGTAADPDQPANTLGITINGNPTTASSNGVTVSGVAIGAGGAVTANVSTTCAATSATFTLVVTDSQSATGNGTLTVTVTPNMPPMLGYANQVVTAGTTPSFLPNSGPSDNGTFTIGSVSVSPNNGGLGVLLNQGNGQVIVLNALLIGTYTITVPATDNCGATTLAMITVNVVCPAITVNPGSLPNATLNTAYPQTISASPAGGNYTFAVTSGILPNGLTLNSNGSFSGAPTQSGTFNFRITASGFGGCTGFRDYSLTVLCPTITLAPASLPNGSVGTAYNQNVSASPAGSYNYAVVSGSLPTGLTLNNATGAITGTPTLTGTFTFTISASIGGCSGSQAYSITIICPTITLTPATLPNGQAGVAYSQALTVNPAGTYTFSIVTGSLPAGVTLNPTTGLISGLPSTTGNYAFTVKAQTAGGCFGTQAYTLAIVCPTVLVNPSVALPNGTAGVFYSQSFSATPAGGAYTFAVTMGTVPTGLILNTLTGVLSGIPTVNGTFNFRITATGFGSCTGFRDYTVVIGTGGCPTITLPATLPNGGVGQLYIESVAASPADSYTYAVTAGSLPTGLTLYGGIGLLFGYPTTPGISNFTITATSASMCTGSQAYSVNVGVGASLLKTGASEVTVVSAASYQPDTTTPGGILAAFGDGLAETTEPASTIPLPTELGGTLVLIKDAAGAAFAAPIFFVSSQQVNFQVPEEASLGEAELTVVSGDGKVSQTTMLIVPVAPGLFAANADGEGAPAGFFLRVAGDSRQVEEPAAVVDSLSGLKVPKRVTFGASSEDLYLVLNGTGIRGLSGLAGVSVRVGGVAGEVTYAGPQTAYVGLDQINVRLPRTLIGRGDVEVEVIIDGKVSNALRIHVE